MHHFFDIHCHLMSFDEPDFIMFMKQVGDNFGKEALNTMLSPDYLLDFKNKHLPLKAGNLINVMSHSQSQMAEIIERDLRGEFLPEGEKAFAPEGQFTFDHKPYDKYVICPMVMDFTSSQALTDIYYATRSPKDAFWYADKMLRSIRTFYVEHEQTFLEILPFAGINPPAYSLEEIDLWLITYFKNYSTKEHYQNKENPHFFGIKLYPPLGFDPWPENEEERQKVELIYSYAQTNNIPITTHCDDEGYRTTDMDQSHHNTSPETWSEVLKKYPQLKLNFAHFGRQYQRTHFMRKQENWRDKIIELMLQYDKVYADLSFNGVSPEYYNLLIEKLLQYSKTEQKLVGERLMFGSDFMINLTKIESYHHYLKQYETSGLLSDEKRTYAEKNCRNFLFENVESSIVEA